MEEATKEIDLIIDGGESDTCYFNNDLQFAKNNIGRML